jgi:hypothetical protein
LNQTNEFINFIIHGVIIKQGRAWIDCLSILNPMVLSIPFEWPVSF